MLATWPTLPIFQVLRELGAQAGGASVLAASLDQQYIAPYVTPQHSLDAPSTPSPQSPPSMQTPQVLPPTPPPLSTPSALPPVGPPTTSQGGSALQAALAGNILPLRLLTVDVIVVPGDGAARQPNVAGRDPVIAIACEVHTENFGSQGWGQEQGKGPAQASTGPTHAGDLTQPFAPGLQGPGTIDLTLESSSSDSEDEMMEMGEERMRGRGARSSPGPAPITAGGQGSGRVDGTSLKVLFLLTGPSGGQQGGSANSAGRAGAGSTAGGKQENGGVAELHKLQRMPCGALPHLFSTEAQLLQGFREWMLRQDPDSVVTYQVCACLWTMGKLGRCLTYFCSLAVFYIG